MNVPTESVDIVVDKARTDWNHKIQYTLQPGAGESLCACCQCSAMSLCVTCSGLYACLCGMYSGVRAMQTSVYNYKHETTHRAIRMRTTE